MRNDNVTLGAFDTPLLRAALIVGLVVLAMTPVALAAEGGRAVWGRLGQEAGEPHPN